LAIAAHFKPHDANLKIALPRHLLFQFLEGRTGEFHDGAAAEAGHVAVVAIGPRFVKVLFALKVHQV
jgi:hypothetical protein